MTRKEHLFQILSEECMEVSHRVSKALRFGLDEIQSGQPLTNIVRIELEIADLLGAIETLIDAGCIDNPSQTMIHAKKEKIEKYLAYSRSVGTLQE